MKIDINSIKESPQFQQFIDLINKNPIQALKELTVLSETDNDLTRIEGGRELLNELKSKININPESIESDSDFQPIELNDEIKKKIDENPEQAYKDIYNIYTYEPADIPTKLKIRKGLYAVRNYLLDKNINPDELLNKNPVVEGLNAIANVLSIPSNALAKVFAENPDKVPIWGGSGWEETLRQYGTNEEIQKITKKAQEGIPLTSDETSKLKDFDNKYAILGFMSNLVLDPFVLASAGGKAATAISKGTGWLGKLGKTLEVIGSPIKSFKEAKTISEIEKSGELGNVLATTLTTTRSLLNKFPDSLKLINDIDDLLKLYPKKIPKNTVFEVLKKSSDFLSNHGLKEEAGQILKAMWKTDDVLKQAEKINKSKIFQMAQKADDKFNNIIHNFKEKTGIRKIFQSDVPLEYKAGIEKARLMKTGVLDEVQNIGNTIKKQIDIQLVPLLKSNKSIIEYINKNNKTINNVITDLIERPWEAIKKYNIAKDSEEFKILNNIKDVFNDFIINEAKFSGDKIKPLFATKEQIDNWSNISNSYSKLFKSNPFSPDLQVYENKLRNMLRNTNGMNILDNNMNEELLSNIAYLTHVMTPEAKKIYQTFSGKSRGYFSEGFKSYITNVSKRKRGWQGTINEINEEINKGSFADYLRTMAHGESAEKAEGLLRLANDFDKFRGKNIDFFSTDVPKLVQIRGGRMARTIEQQVLFDEVSKFGSKFKEQPNWRIPTFEGKPIAGFNKYFDPDVATVIENTWNYTRNSKQLGILSNFINDFSNFWKATTLSTHIQTGIRNTLGNLLNSILVVKKPSKLLAAHKDAIFAMMGQNYKVITQSGKYLDIQTIFKEFRARGGTGVTFRAMDTHRLEFRENIARSFIGKTVENLSNTLDKWSNWFRNLPPAKLSELMEKTNKFGLFMYEVLEGKSYDEAIKTVWKALFDYSDLTQAEKAIKRVIPFFTWTRKNLPLQISNIFSSPSRMIFKLWKSANKTRPSEEKIDERMQTEFLKTKAKIKTSSDLGKANYFLVEGFFPVFDLTRIVRTINDNHLKNTIDDIVSDVTPLIKTPVEILTNRSFVTKQDLMKSKGELVNYLGFYMSPKLKTILDDWRVLTTANQAFDIRPDSIATNPKSWVRLLTTFFIGNTIPYDSYVSKIYASKDARKDIMDELINFNAWINKIKGLLLSGKKMSKYDAEVIRNRAKGILMMIKTAGDEGKISQKEKASYLKQFFKNFLGG